MRDQTAEPACPMFALHQQAAYKNEQSVQFPCREPVQEYSCRLSAILRASFHNPASPMVSRGIFLHPEYVSNLIKTWGTYFCSHPLPKEKPQKPWQNVEKFLSGLGLPTIDSQIFASERFEIGLFPLIKRLV